MKLMAELPALVQGTVEDGTIAWPDDGLDMAPEPLYAEARQRQVHSASVGAR
jgi:hypothetical protein